MIVANRNLTSCLFSVGAKYLMHSNSWINILLHQQWLCVGKQLKQKDQHRQNCKCLVIILRPSVSLFPSNNVNEKNHRMALCTNKGRGVFRWLRLKALIHLTQFCVLWKKRNWKFSTIEYIELKIFVFTFPGTVGFDRVCFVSVWTSRNWKGNIYGENA